MAQGSILKVMEMNLTLQDASDGILTLSSFFFPLLFFETEKYTIKYEEEKAPQKKRKTMTKEYFIYLINFEQIEFRYSSNKANGLDFIENANRKISFLFNVTLWLLYFLVHMLLLITTSLLY